jgi:hypothetical protein
LIQAVKNNDAITIFSILMNQKASLRRKINIFGVVEEKVLDRNLDLNESKYRG